MISTAKAPRRAAGLPRRLLTLAGALALDTLVGEPSPHPVRGIGALLRRGRAATGVRPPLPSLLGGALTLGVVAGGAALAGRWVEGRLARAPLLPGAAAGAFLLKPALALDALLDAGRAVEEALARGDLPEARRLLGWHLVSRDTGSLTPSQVASGAIESLAENLVDSVVAPAAAALVAGLPGAWAYRVVNTADAMFGYRTPELEWFGKVPALVDDALNLLPARWTGVALLAAGEGARGMRPGRVRHLAREARKAAGPNAGWPMAAAALALGVTLEKPGVYHLNPGGRPPEADDIGRARTLLVRGALVSLGTLAAAVAAGTRLAGTSAVVAGAGATGATAAATAGSAARRSGAGRPRP